LLLFVCRFNNRSPMTNVVKNFVGIPPAIQRSADTGPGDLMEIKATPGRITIVTSTEPLQKDGYTLLQRKSIDAQLAKAAQGPFHGPFRRGAEVRAYLTKFKREKPNKSSEAPPQTGELYSVQPRQWPGLFRGSPIVVA